MTKLNLTEIELAERWGISPKTLQRWRSERRGPSYIKLSKRVTYPIEDILAFESSQKKVRQNSHAFTVQQAAALAPQICTEDPPAVAPPDDNALVSWEEAIRITKLPSYFLRTQKYASGLKFLTTMWAGISDSGLKSFASGRFSGPARLLASRPTPPHPLFKTKNQHQTLRPRWGFARPCADSTTELS